MSNQLSLEQALKDLEAEGAEPRQKPAGADPVLTSLPLNHISKRTAVFQPRTLDGSLAEDEEFIHDLVKVLKNSGGRPMDPITVWYGGRNFYVIDGHHRLEAYKRYWGENCGEKIIPCTEFKGSLIEAMEFAGQANHKNKMPMRQDEKMNFAWRLVCISDLTANRFVDAAGVALRTVRTMRAKLREKIGADKPENETSYKRQLGGETWKDIQKGHEKFEEHDWEKKQEAEAMRMARRLKRDFGSHMHRKAHILARALVILDNKLPMKMVQAEAWEEHIDEIKAWLEAFEIEEVEEVDEGYDPRKKVYFKKDLEF